MASPNPDAANTSTTTKQITMAAFKKYMEKATNKQDRHPSRSPHPPTSDTEVGTRDSLHPQTSNSPSPPLSPSAITPTTLSDPEDCWSEESTGCRHTSLSGPTQMNLDSLMTRFGHDVDITSAQEDQVTNVIVNRLRVIGDEFEERLQSRGMWNIICDALLSPDRTILQQFSEAISSLKKELSLQMIVKVFYFGYRLIETLHPVDMYGEQQWQILEVFINFLLNELSEWIDQQGGWESILSSDAPRSYSTSALPDMGFHNQIEDRTPTNETSPEPEVQPHSQEEGMVVSHTQPSSSRTQHQPSHRSQSLSIPRGPRSRPTTLPLGLPHSYPRRQSQVDNSPPSAASPRSRSSLGNVVSFGIGVSFGIALCTFFFK